ncbi:MAG: DUF1622 domain-containing protein [Planctomycetota bacterium]|jgi:uncharacterized membrane protein
MKEFITIANEYVVYICQLLAMAVITVGVCKAMVTFLKDVLFGQKSSQAIQESRMEMGHSFSLGLSFLIGGSILKSTLAPTWNDIGQLAAIIAIRTVLNYFLLAGIAKEKSTNEEENGVSNGAEAKGETSGSASPEDSSAS